MALLLLFDSKDDVNLVVEVLGEHIAYGTCVTSGCFKQSVDVCFIFKDSQRDLLLLLLLR